MAAPSINRGLSGWLRTESSPEGSALCRAFRPLKLPKLFIGHLEKLLHQRVDSHFIGESSGLRETLNASVFLIRQVKPDVLLARLWMLRYDFPCIQVSIAVSKPFEAHRKRFCQFRDDLRSRLAPALLVPRNLRGGHAADLGQVSLGPAMAGARLDEALWKFAVHFFQN